MKHRSLFLCLLFSSLLLMSGLVYAETGFGSGFAGMENGELVINTGGDVYLQVSNPPHKSITSLVWSADGRTLAYVLSDEQYQSHLLVVDAEVGSPVMLAAGPMEAGFPITFTPDGDILYAQSTYDSANPSPDYKVNFNRIAPQAGATPITLGTVAFNVGCGGGSPIPADWQYWAESGFGGNYLTLRWTDQGILYSMDCAGNGLGVLDPATGEVRYLTPVKPADNGRIIPENYGRTAFSPDGRTVALIKTEYAEPDPIETLVLVDIASGQMTEVPTRVQPDQITWSNDGTLYYSSYSFNTERQAQIAASLNAEQTQRVEAYIPLAYLPVREVAIHQVNPADGSENMIYSADAYAVGRLSVAQDGSLWFSQIANLDQWVRGLADGTLDPVNDVNDSQTRATIPVTVMRYDPASQSTAQVRTHFNQFTLQPAARG